MPAATSVKLPHPPPSFASPCISLAYLSLYIFLSVQFSLSLFPSSILFLYIYIHAYLFFLLCDISFSIYYQISHFSAHSIIKIYLRLAAAAAVTTAVGPDAR